MKTSLILSSILLFCCMIFSPLSLSAVRSVDNFSDQANKITAVQEQIHDGGIMQRVRSWIKKMRPIDKEERKKHLGLSVLWIALTILGSYVLYFILATIAIILAFGGASMVLSTGLLILAIILPATIAIVIVGKLLRKYYAKIEKIVKRSNVSWQSILIVIGGNLIINGLLILSSLIP